MSNEGKKRLDAVWALTSYAVSGGIITAVGVPGTEIPKQITLTASDVMLYGTIWKIYFEEELSSKKLLDVLAELGLITVAAAGTAYVVARGSSALLREITNRFGPVGWGVSAAITSSATGAIGAVWIWYCEQLYLKRSSQNSQC